MLNQSFAKLKECMPRQNGTFTFNETPFSSVQVLVATLTAAYTSIKGISLSMRVYITRASLMLPAPSKKNLWQANENLFVFRGNFH